MSKAAEIVDQVTGNPAFDGLGGYYIFLRRVLIPLVLAGVCLSSYSLMSTWFDHGVSIVVAGMFTGLSVGPILTLEKMYGLWLGRRIYRQHYSSILGGKGMVGIIDFVFGLLDATGVELMFGASALIGGVLFLLWLVLVVVLGGIGDIAEGVFGVDIDAMGADASFKALTFQGVMAFMMFFGLTGIIVMQSGGQRYSRY